MVKRFLLRALKPVRELLFQYIHLGYFLIFSINSFSQNETSKWYFGRNVAFDYTTAGPVITLSKAPSIYDTDAEYPGGISALQKYIRENLRYPEISQNYFSHGVFYARFNIDTSGQVVNIHLSTVWDTLIFNEIKRVLTQMPRWKPATQNGSQYCLPCSFL